MNMLIYSAITQKQYLLAPVCANYTLIKKGINSALHYHSVYHMMFISHGQGYLENDKGKYLVSHGDIFVVHPGERHILSTYQDSGMTFFSFNFYLIDICSCPNVNIDKILTSLDDKEYLEDIAIKFRLDQLFNIPFKDIYIDFNTSVYDKISSMINHLNDLLIFYETYSIIVQESKLSYGRFLNANYSKFLWDINNIITTSNDWALSTKDKKLLDQIINYLQKNIYEKYNLNELSGTLNYSRIYLCSFFKRSTGITINQYFNKLKINKSCEYLKTTDKSITQIAELFNFSSPNHFTKIFKQEKDMLPKDYRKHIELL